MIFTFNLFTNIFISQVGRQVVENDDRVGRRLHQLLHRLFNGRRVVENDDRVGRRLHQLLHRLFNGRLLHRL
jgi:hypothetical protein